MDYGQLILPGVFALASIAAVYFAANYFAKTLLGQSHKRRHTIIAAVFGYTIVAVIAYFNLRNLV